MRFGPTSLKLHTVLARTLRRPKLRTDLRVSRQVMGGEESVVINVPGTMVYSRIGTLEYEVLTICDGTRTPAEIAAEMKRRDPESVLDETEVADFLETVEPELWEKSLGEKNLAILEKIKEERSERVSRNSILYIYFKAWDPDKFLDRIHPYLKWMFTPGFVIFSVVLFVLIFVIVAADWPRIRQDTVDFYGFTNKTAYDIWVFWILLFFVSMIHEFGHGLSCKHFGGQVHQMGLMLVFFTPAFYTDCTDMHMFDRTSKRLWTIFNGLWIETVLCGLSTLVWYFSMPGSFVSDIAYKTLLLTGVSGLFFNLNPLMKFDGYYALAQYLGIDNMREDSFSYLRSWVLKYVFRKDVDLPAASKRKRRVFLIFGTAAFLYGTLVLVLFSLFIRNVFTSKFGDWGYPLTFLAVYMLLRKRIQKAWPSMVSGLRDAKEKLMAWRLTRLQQAGLVGILLLISIPPTPTEVATEFVLEPGERADVRPGVAGNVMRVDVLEGQSVAAGAVLAVLGNPDVTTRVIVAAQQLALFERELMAARERADLGAVQRAAESRQHAQTELSEARRKQDGLILTAPFAGIVTTPRVETMQGTFLVEGQEFARIADRSHVHARILVRDWELEEVAPGAAVKLKVRAYPFRTFEGVVERILPAAALDRPVTDP
ncbi:MAG TPA: efflux RND transporter periplasmic adaptor subunit, partial [Terriglobia bacterium]